MWSTTANSIPELTGPTRVNVTVNQTTSIVLNASDADDATLPTYVVVSQPSSGFTFDNNTQTVEWTPASNDTARLE